MRSPFLEGEIYMLKKNQTAELEIEDFTNEGMGVGRLDGMVVFVPFAAPGDIMEVLIVKVNASYAYGKCLRLKRESQYRRKPECPVYGRCGGCRMMHMEYAFQLELKKKFIRDALTRLGGIESVPEIEMIGAEPELFYRNKMVYPVGTSKGRTVCGFYAGRSHDIVPLSGCSLGLRRDDKIISALLAYMEKYKLVPYDEKSRKGSVRRLFIRRGRQSGETMVIISAACSRLASESELARAVLDADSSVTGVILNINKKATNLVLGGENRVLYGRGFIRDTLCGNEYEISPHSFYQINPAQTEILYNKALEYAGIQKTDTVMDIYCGIGTISLAAAPLAEKVIGIEIVPEAVTDAKRNALVNGISNADFFAGSAEEIVPRLIESGSAPGVVILDPPRKGSDAATLTAISAAAPRTIVYVSCNPATLARDVKFLQENGYALEKVTGVDMFPETVHVETVCQLVLRRSPIHINIDVDVEELVQDKRGSATYEQIKVYVLEHSGLNVSSLNIAQAKQKCGIIERENYNKPKAGNAKQPQCPPEKEAAIMEALRHFVMI